MLASDYKVTETINKTSVKITSVAVKSIKKRGKGQSHSSEDRLIMELGKRKWQLLQYQDPDSGHVATDDEITEIVSQLQELGDLYTIVLSASRNIAASSQGTPAGSNETATWGKIIGNLPSQQDLVDYIDSQVLAADPAYTNQGGILVATGGMKAGDVPAALMKGIFDQMFYPFLEPAFTSFSTDQSIQEVGASITPTIQLDWSIYQGGNVKNAADSGNIAANDTIDTSDLGDFNIFGLTQKVLTLNTPYTKDGIFDLVFTLTGKDANDNPIPQITTSIDFGIRIYWGTSATPLLTLEAEVKALSGSLVAQSRNRNYQMSGGGFSFLCIPQDIAQAGITFTDPNTGFPYAMDTQDTYAGVATISVTNINGVVDIYNIYRSDNSLGSATTLKVT